MILFLSLYTDALFVEMIKFFHRILTINNRSVMFHVDTVAVNQKKIYYARKEKRNLIISYFHKIVVL